ncbi:MAG: heparan-alpha-glucosaminide N-acetyltransferase domain-containing protein [Prosthecobacter sp.]
MPPTSQRLEWLDLFRGLAVLGMVWTHAANTFLTAELKASAWFVTMTSYHGLIAPAFFWIAGYARAHVTMGKTKPAWPVAKRLLLVWLIGYLMHVPWDHLLDAQAMRAVATVDVLHCLAVSGLILLAVEKLGKGREAAALVLMLFFVGLEKSAREWQTGILMLDQYFNRLHGSQFALFPWVGFGLAGFITRRAWDGQLNRSAAGVVLAGVTLAWGLSWLDDLPAFFMERLGWVMMAAVAVAGMAGLLSRFTGWLRLAGRESLLLYVAHLMLIHSIPLPKQPLQHLIGPTQHVGGVLAVFAGLFAASWLLGAWNERRKKVPITSR